MNAAQASTRRRRKAEAAQVEAEGFSEAEAIQAELDRETARAAKAALAAPRGFDPSCLFLLGMGWENLFEQAHSRDARIVRCKGCQAVVPLGDRQKHYNRHKTAIANKEEQMTPSTKPESKAEQNRRQREAKANGEAPPVEDVTGKPPAARGGKTAAAMDAAIEVLKAAGKAMTVTEVMSHETMSAVNRGTLIVMLSKELRSEKPRVKRVGKGTYEAV